MADTAILCGTLECIGWSVESRNAFTNKEFCSIQSLTPVTQSYLKMTVLRIGCYLEYLFCDKKRGWTLEMYDTLQQKCHQTLDECDKPVAPAQQAKDFFDGNSSFDRIMATDLVASLTTHHLHLVTYAPHVAVNKRITTAVCSTATFVSSCLNNGKIGSSIREVSASGSKVTCGE